LIGWDASFITPRCGNGVCIRSANSAAESELGVIDVSFPDSNHSFNYSGSFVLNRYWDMLAAKSCNMKKVLLAFDGSNFSEGAFDFAKRLNDIEPLLVTGVFIPQVDYANLWSYAAAMGVGAGPTFVPLMEGEDAELINKNILHFEELCQKNGVAYRVHKAFYDFALPELKKESRFADVMVIGGEVFYKGVMESSQFEYLRDALHAAECSVVVVPEKYEFPDNVLLAYDGSEESVYAIKQFAYVFPELTQIPTLLIYGETEEEKDFPSKNYIVELVTQHYKNLSFYKLEMNPKKYFATWIEEREGSLLVSGSFSRSSFSQLFKKSFVADIIKDHKLPVFIAHR
jgi:nucleotide-binding universal stress UspA family protein